MRRSFILCSVVVLLMLIGCNCQGQKQPFPTPSIPPSSLPLSPPPAVMNSSLPPDQIVFVVMSTHTAGSARGRCEPYTYHDGPWLWEYFPADHHMAIHYLAPGQHISEALVLIGYIQFWSGAAGTGYATDDLALAEELPYAVSTLEDTRIMAVDASGSIVIEVADREYWLEPGQAWSTSESTIQDGCRVSIRRRLQNYGLMNRDQIWVN